MPTTRERQGTSESRRGTRSRAGAREAGRERSRDRRSGARAERGERRITAKNLRADDRRFLEQHLGELSDSTLRAKWIHDPGEHADRPGQTLATRSPDVIRAWAEARGAEPATVGRREGERPRTLRFDFPRNGTSNRLQPVGWSEWLSTFADRRLVFIYQEQRRNGGDSNFCRLDSPERQEG